MHKFKVGSVVRVKAGQGVKLAGVYEVVRLLPADETGTPTYQVKGLHEEYMRVVSQHHIESATQEEAVHDLGEGDEVRRRHSAAGR